MNQNKPNPVVAYRVNADAYRKAVDRLAQLPYGQVIDVFQALDRGTQPIYQEQVPMKAPEPEPKAEPTNKNKGH